MRETKKIFILILICLSAPYAEAQDTLLFKQVERLETEVKNLRDSLNLQSEHIKQYEALNKSIDDFESLIKNPTKWLITRGFILMGALIGLIALFFFILNKTNPSWYVVLIQSLVDRNEKVNQLKRTKKILVVSSTSHPDNEVFLQSLFEKQGFKNVVNISFNNAEEYLKKNNNKDKVHIVFANNEDRSLAQEDLENLIEKRKTTAFFYFGKPGSWDFRKYGKEEPEFLNRINFANSRSQIYGNLVSTMVFQTTLLGIR